MKMNDFPYRVNEQGVRGVATLVFTLSIIAILTKSLIPIAILFVDFFLRAFFTPKYSLLALVSKKIIIPVAGFRKRMVIFKPKKFAAGIGMVLSLTASILVLSNLTSFGIIVLLLLSVFSFLEAFFGFCAGCKVFGFLIKLGVLKEDECIDCVLGDGDGI